MLPDDTQSRVRRAMLLVSAWKDLAQDDFTMVLASKDAEPGQIIEALTMRSYLRATQNNIKAQLKMQMLHLQKIQTLPCKRY